MSGNPKAAILEAFFADSLALGARWVCDTGVIAVRSREPGAVISEERLLALMERIESN